MGEKLVNHQRVKMKQKHTKFQVSETQGMKEYKKHDWKLKYTANPSEAQSLEVTDTYNQ